MRCNMEFAGVTPWCERNPDRVEELPKGTHVFSNAHATLENVVVRQQLPKPLQQIRNVSLKGGTLIIHNQGTQAA